MERSLKVKRIFSMGSYQNLEVEDVVTGIPQELALNEDFVGVLSKLQLLNLERRVNNYYILRSKYHEATPEEALLLIEDEIAQTKAQLYSYIS